MVLVFKNNCHTGVYDVLPMIQLSLPHRRTNQMSPDSYIGTTENYAGSVCLKSISRARPFEKKAQGYSADNCSSNMLATVC